MSAHVHFTKDGAATQHNAPWVKQLCSNRSEDTNIAAAAIRAIEVLTTIPPESIKITAHNGWLLLEGAVNGRHQRNVLEDVTRDLPGVKGVTNSVSIHAAP